MPGDVESAKGEPSTSAAASGQPEREAPLQPASPGRPKGGGGLWGLLKGLLQRLWGGMRRRALSVGPLIPGQRLLLIKRLRNGAAYGIGAKLVLTSKSSWQKVVEEPLVEIVGFLRPFKLTVAFAVAGAGANAVLYFLQLRYHATDLSVLPPEGLWQQTLRTMFGARPPREAAKAGEEGEQPLLPPPAPSVPPPPAPPTSQAELEQQQQQQQAAAAAAAERSPTVPASPTAAGTPTQFTASPTSSFVDITTVPSPVQLQLGGGGESGAGPSIEEGWTKVGRSGQETPQQQGSPTAAAAGGAAEGEAQEQAGDGEAAAAAAAAARLIFEHVGRAGAGEQ